MKSFRSEGGTLSLATGFRASSAYLFLLKGGAPVSCTVVRVLRLWCSTSSWTWTGDTSESIKRLAQPGPVFVRTVTERRWLPSSSAATCGKSADGGASRGHRWESPKSGPGLGTDSPVRSACDAALSRVGSATILNHGAQS